jgi:hypothetical protein
VLQVGAMKRHDQGVQYARRFITERLGQVRSFNAWYRIGDLRPSIEAVLFPHHSGGRPTGPRRPGRLQATRLIDATAAAVETSAEVKL